MGRTKKDYISINMKADADIVRRFNAYCETVGQTKTLAFERIVSEYLDRYDRKERQTQESKTRQE